MANTTSQAAQIRDLLVERLEAFDPTFDLAQGSSLYEQVVAPVFRALSVDPFDTDIEEFLKTRLKQEFPTLSVQDGDAIVDIVIRPLQLLLEGFKREIQIIRTGQSTRNASQMRIQDAEDLAANFFVSRNAGSRATGTVRIFFANPTFVSILVGTRFSAGGLGFFPTVPQFFRPEIVAAQRSGQLYYVDIAVIAESPGAAYNVPAGAINTVAGIEAAVRVTNQFEFGGGSDEESAAEILARTQTALTERSLNTRRGIRARIFSEFPSVRNLEVVGFGDPEMQRDKITGAGGGDVICSGMSLILGRYMILLSMFENKGRDGRRRIRAGGQIDLNFWKFLYGGVRENQRFVVEEVLYESSEDLEGIPTVYLLRLNQSPDVEAPPGSLIPGLLPGVFASAYDRAEIRISGIPGGITNPDEGDEIVLRDDQVHIGGHYDVYVRPSRTSIAVANFGAASGEISVYEGTDLFTVSDAEIPEELRDYRASANKVHARLRLRLASVVGLFALGEVIHFSSNGSTPELDTGGLSYAVQISSTENYIDLVALTSDNEWATPGYVIGLTSGATATIVGVEQTIWEDYGIQRGMTLSVVNGPDVGSYKIMDVRGPELVLDTAMTVLGGDYRFRIINEVVLDAFAPKAPIYPFAGATASDLRTVIGTATVRTDVDLISYGASVGSVLEILDGPNVGEYRIAGFDSALGGRGPVLETALPATDSNVSFRVYAAGTGLSRPLVRVAPGGMVVQTASGQSTGYAVPPSLPVGARAVDGFSGARESQRGMNGFVFPDAGFEWAPTEHVRLRAYDVDSVTGAKSGTGSRSPDGTIKAADLVSIAQYSGRPGTCYTDECLPTDDDYVAVMTLLSDPAVTTGHSVQTNLSIALPSAVQGFLDTIRGWLVDLTTSFSLGDDFRAFFDLFAPFTMKDLDEHFSGWSILAQYEVLIPKALFDGCNNIFIAAPEIDWKAIFSNEVTFEEAMSLYNNGNLPNTPAALSRAKPGDILTIDEGANAGSYVIDKVYTYKVYHGGCIVSGGSEDYLDDRLAYTFAIVKIKNEFPVNPYAGLSGFVPRTAPALSLYPPSFNVTASIATGPRAGDTVNPWELVQESFTWLFQTLASAGYNVPSEFVVNPGSVLKKIVDGFFDNYVVAKPTAEQIVRLYFTEPTSVTVYGPSACVDYQWTENDELTRGVYHPHAPTLFSVPAGAEELLFVAAGTEPPRQVFPGATRTGRTPPTELPRDITLSEHTAGVDAFDVTPSDALLSSFLAAGVQPGSDFLHIYEQRTLLTLTGSGEEKETDRVAVVTTQANSSTLRIPRLNYGSREFTFLSPSSDSDQDVVRPGDYIFIEEGDGAGGYRITEVGDDYVNVDRPMPASTAQIYKSGNEGSVEAGSPDLVDLNNPFTSQDVGRYLTIYLSNFEEVDGSYQITAVSPDGSTVTLDRDDFAFDETGVHWSVVKAPVDNLDDSSIGGTTELLGVRPVRIYSGVPSVWRIATVHPSTDRLTSTVRAIYQGGSIDVGYARQRELEVNGPVRGVKQPYEIVRPHTVHMPSSTMRTQGTENGLFYMDVRAYSLGGRPVYNIPKDAHLTPVFGTYDSDGYRMEVIDSLYTYSAAEQCKIYFSASFLPSDLNDVAENRVVLNGAVFTVRHEYSAEVGQIQALLTSNLNRILCADPLARHFLPSFVYLDIEASGGNRTKMAAEIANYINSLQPDEVLDVSKIEKFLHSNNVTSYRHPIILQIITHDLDRRRVLTRSTDAIGLEEGTFNGTHRTTFYIPGAPTTTEPGTGQERILIRARSANA